MATYLVVQSGGQTKSYTCKSTHASTPYLKVSNSYLDLTTQSHTGVRLKVVSNNVAYYPVVQQTVTLTSTVTYTETTGISGRSSRKSTSGYSGYSSSKQTTGITGRSSAYYTRTTNRKVYSITATIYNLSTTNIGTWEPEYTSIGKTTKSENALVYKYTRSTYTPTITSNTSRTTYAFNNFSVSNSWYTPAIATYSSYQFSFTDKYSSRTFVNASAMPASFGANTLSYTMNGIRVTRTHAGSLSTDATMVRRAWGDAAYSYSYSYITYQYANKTIATNIASNTNWISSEWLTEQYVDTYYTRSNTTNAGISSTTALTKSVGYYTTAVNVEIMSSTTALTRSSSYYTSSVTTNAGISSITELTVTNTSESTYTATV